MCCPDRGLKFLIIVFWADNHIWLAGELRWLSVSNLYSRKIEATYTCISYRMSADIN